jgi:predicted nucleic acid-binding protein
VVDASVAFKWFVQEDGTDRALALLERGEPIIAPDLIVAEVCNAAWKSLRRGELAPAQMIRSSTTSAQSFVRLVPLDLLIRSAAALTRLLDHPIYDCGYLALADSDCRPALACCHQS